MELGSSSTIPGLHTTACGAISPPQSFFIETSTHIH